MKRAGVFAAGVALAASTLIATPTFGATRQNPCDVLQKQLNTLEHVTQKGADLSDPAVQLAIKNYQGALADFEHALDL